MDYFSTIILTIIRILKEEPITLEMIQDNLTKLQNGNYTRKKQEIYNYAKDPYEYYKEFGYSANAMPTLPLEEQELKDVADYIDSLQPFKKWMKKKK